MKIAVLTSGILPIPAVKGGAVENLIDFYLEYNERHRLHDITVYSVGDKLTAGHEALQSEVNHYRYIEIWSPWAKIRKRIYKWSHPQQQYFHYTIEYYLERALSDIARKNYDVVILENRPAYSLKVAGRTRARLVCHLHNDFLNADTRQALPIYNALSRVITVSDFIASRVRTLETNGGTKCVTVKNAINREAFTNPTVDGPTRQDLGLLPTDFVLAYSGRINAEKGIAQLVQAMTLIKDARDVKLLVMGGSFFGDNVSDDPFISRLKQQAAQLEGRITFTGFVPYHRIPAYLRLADAAIIPSQWEEPFGLTCLEAMAAGKPIIASRRGGIPEVLHDEYAILLPAHGGGKEEDFVAQLASAILNLQHHPDICKRMGAAALAASLQYDKEQYAQQFFNALESLKPHQ